MLEENNSNEIEIKTKSKAGTLVGVFLVLISIAAYTFFARGVSADVAAIKADVTSKLVAAEQLKAELDQLESAEKELDLTTEVKKARAKGAIPPKMEQDNVIRDVIDIAEENDITLKTIGFGKGSSNQEGVSTLSVNASFEGNYEDLISFLTSVEEHSRLFVIKTINVQISKVEVINIDRATFSIAMDAFYQSK